MDIPFELYPIVVELIPYDSWIDICHDKENLPFMEVYVNAIPKNCWRILCQQEWSLHFLKKYSTHLDQKCWDILCQQKWAFYVLCENVDKLDLRTISKHTWALPIVKNMLNKNRQHNMYISKNIYASPNKIDIEYDKNRY